MLVSELDLHQRHVPLLLLFGQSLLLRQTERGLHRAHRLPVGFGPSLLLYGGLHGPGVLLLHTPTGARSCCLGNRGGCWDVLPSASAFTPLLPVSMSVAESL